MKALVIFCLAIAVCGACGEESSLAELISGLGAESFRERERCSEELAWRVADERLAVLKALVAAERSPNPEVRFRSKLTLRLCYLRNELGRGAPAHGMTFKSKVLTINRKLRTRPMVATVEEQGAAAEAGIEPDDLIVRIDGEKFVSEDSVAELKRYLNSRKPGVGIKIVLARERNGKREEVVKELHLPDSGKVEMALSAEEEADYLRWRSRLDGLLESQSDQ